VSERGEAEPDTEAATDVAAEDTPEAGTKNGADGPPVGEGRSERGLSRRTWTLLCSLVVVVALGLIGGLVPIPYVALGPGPTYDTLSAVDGVPVVSVTGHPTYKTSGQLRMVTVSLIGDVTMFGALGMWMSGTYSLAPQEDYQPPGESQQDVQQQNLQEFKDSQSEAEVSALRYLKYPVDVVAQEILTNGPSDKILTPGDQFVTVNGRSVSSAEDVKAALANTLPGQVVDLTVRSGSGPTRDVKIKLGSSPDLKQGVIGVTPASHADVNFHIDIKLSDIRGPSAGLMFALAVVDKLTPLNLNGGLAVAGTGTIDDIGTVGPIGGIPFKLVAARDAGATVFLTPADNCSEALTHVPAGLRLVKVTSLASAISELSDLKAGKPVPGC
jgi:Lon-like protease